ncbi:hypothetical protein TCAL_06670 [Tigriopus californicus]|uniref:Uncharacterized protein n=1 Tax=Tigriopus californicus TaxID=6832 RepID=A0A553N876_TIGCA|nr:large ribosomal subunit protein bL32m-like [Tigriopus californicus]TRY61641.1 hypothetical protein TCAL_06670 [Tigriopus californicus]|eukprot:TCALIF_06670-PA protein Name:"Similar to mRpL32 39S ribosomal protein L32, mitochondrial (Drosophila melanogaster)" AED:0.02 eAED:0.02 QI:329/1/1/1/1/1/2/63/202
MALRRFLYSCRDHLSLTVDEILLMVLQQSGRTHPPTALMPCLAPVSLGWTHAHHRTPSDPLKDDFGLLLAVPKQRRNWRNRMCRKFGAIQWGTYKYPLMNRNMRVDHKTGEFFRLGVVAPKFYEQVKHETREIQAKMSDVFGLAPKDKEVIIKYENEEDPLDGDRKVVEMSKPRPSFFTSNLSERVATSPKDSTTVRPSGLG